MGSSESGSAERVEVCDFCLAKGEFVVHHTTRFVLPSDGILNAYVDMDGEWNACPECHELIETGKKAKLEQRFTPHSADEKRWHRRLIAAYWAHRID